MKDRTWRLDQGRFTARDLDDETIVLDLKSGDYYTLDGAGAFGFRLFAKGSTMAAVVDAMMERYDAPERARVEADVAELLRDLEKRGILKSHA